MRYFGLKKYAISAALAAVILISALMSGCSNLQNKFELVSGDIIPSSIKLFNASGKTAKIDEDKSKYKVVFYLDSTNDDCMSRLDCISKMISLTGYKNVGYALVWIDSIPVDELRKAGIDESYNYSLGGRASLSESVPNAFLTDENNKIMMVTGYSYISLINKVIELGGEKDICKRAGEMILNNVAKSGTFHRKDNKKTLLMFVSSSCKSCRAGEDFLKQNIDNVRKKINAITIRPDFDSKQAYDKDFEIDPQQIYFNIYCYALGVEASNRKYPMFIIINGDYSVEKLITDPNEAVKYILES